MAKKSATPPAEMERLTIERKVQKSENYAVLYANDTQVQTTPWTCVWRSTDKLNAEPRGPRPAN